MNESIKGVAALIVCCTIWGLCGLYYKLLSHVPPIEILAHRTLWSLLFFMIVLSVQGRLRLVWQALSVRRSAVLIALAALMISCNWFVFITSILIGKATEASLGYYIFPLVSVVLGMIVFGERLDRAQVLAVGLAAAAVITLTVGLGVAPWISLILAFSFGFYGLVKKGLSVGPVVSVTTEVLLLSPIALAVLWVMHSGETGGAFGVSWRDNALLAFSGILTGLPLVLFSYGARRVRLGTVGLVQYLNPTLQFLVATLIFQEAFSLWYAVAFGMIWTALAIYSTASWRQDRAARRALESS
ncbi:chloramphenicol-sensitive protein RarD [Roseovarius pacificus]|uniref:Chloramphenicol-sensitive protein RarD n=1 Tax=Roseovarius pacificus TaxID=337701 RepID=A0A1M7EGB2_9RHOB|nr:EamA family transporter RarD [Roseovarius pacificus]GGO57895.1 permease [Roseovarius pacificus]SHL90670.1 chloramphenicol-sensitive protein RarD [Roseovarius pacificus]